MLGRGHEPGARIVRDTRLGPPLERCHERVLGEILRQADVAHDPRQAGDERRGLDPPDSLDRALLAGGAHRLDRARSQRAASWTSEG